MRVAVGTQLRLVQVGIDPLDWKPMKTVGKGVREIGVRGRSGAYRVIYTAIFADAVYVLHAFQKKTQRTPQRDLEIAARRYGLLMGNR